MSGCGTGESNEESLNMANFAAHFLEHVMMLAGTTEIKAGFLFGEYLVQIGKLKFAGKTPEEAHKKILFWMLTHKIKHTKEFYEEQAIHVLNMEKQDTEALIEELTKDGMSPFGKQVQDYRINRGHALYNSLQELDSAGQLNQGANQLLDLLREKTGYADLDLTEVVQALADMRSITSIQAS